MAEVGMDKVRRMWEDTVGMDLSHLSDDELVEFAARQALVRGPEDIERYEMSRIEERAEAEYRAKWTRRLAGHLGLSLDALKEAIERTEQELGSEALQQWHRDHNDPHLEQRERETDK